MIAEFFTLHAHEIILGLLLFVVSLVVSSMACLFVILRLPDDYFHAESLESGRSNRPPWQRLLATAAKNIVGVGLVVLGLVMSLPGVPGQGLLTLFMGVVLLDLPGKRAFERRIISRPAILRTCNRLRRRFGKKPFTLATTLPIASVKGHMDSVDARTREDAHGRTK